VPSTNAILSRLRPVDIASIQVRKPGSDVDVPNGVIIVEMKRPGEPRVLYPRVTSPTSRTRVRVDSVLVRSRSGLTSAATLPSDTNSSPGTRIRVVEMPRRQ
jgi:hypothetical protein